MATVEAELAFIKAELHTQGNIRSVYNTNCRQAHGGPRKMIVDFVSKNEAARNCLTAAVAIHNSDVAKAEAKKEAKTTACDQLKSVTKAQVVTNFDSVQFRTWSWRQSLCK